MLASWCLVWYYGGEVEKGGSYFLFLSLRGVGHRPSACAKAVYHSFSVLQYGCPQVSNVRKFCTATSSSSSSAKRAHGLLTIFSVEVGRLRFDSLLSTLSCVVDGAASRSHMLFGAHAGWSHWRQSLFLLLLRLPPPRPAPPVLRCCLGFWMLGMAH